MKRHLGDSMNYLLSGSFAYDTILLFHGKLETHD